MGDNLTTENVITDAHVAALAELAAVRKHLDAIAVAEAALVKISGDLTLATADLAKARTSG